MNFNKFEILLSLEALDNPYWDELENLEVTHRLIFSLKLDDDVISEVVSPYILEKGPHTMSLELDGYIDSNFYPINCGCLEPMCLGLSNGVIKNEVDGVVTWIVPVDAGYENRFQKSEYVFDKESYDAEIDRVSQQVKKIHRENLENVVVVGDFVYLRDFVTHI